jgi:hypothetical protein
MLGKGNFRVGSWLAAAGAYHDVPVIAIGSRAGALRGVHQIEV